MFIDMTVDHLNNDVPDLECLRYTIKLIYRARNA